MIIKTLSLLFLAVGIFMLVQVVTPTLYFKLWEATSTSKQALIDPKAESENVLGVSVENIGDFPAIVSSRVRSKAPPYSEFNLIIPKIGLDWAKVKVDSKNFEENLAHLSGSALPGERGNVFITGHSSLTQFYKRGNYKAVFSRLPDLEIGDEIILVIFGQEYKYIVESLKTFDPKDISVVNPPDQKGRYLSLMTCVPPGFKTKRLVVLAKLK